MRKGDLTDRVICTTAIMYTRVFSVSGAVTNDEVFTLYLMPHVLHLHCPSLPVKPDYPNIHRRTVGRTRYFRQITV